MKQNLTLILLIVVLAAVSFFSYDYYYHRPARVERNRTYVFIASDYAEEAETDEPA